MFCGNCGHDNPGGNNFCGICGNRLLSPQQPAHPRSYMNLRSGDAIPLAPAEPPAQATSPHELAFERQDSESELPISGPSFLGLNERDAQYDRVSYLLDDDTPSAPRWRVYAAILLVLGAGALLAYEWKRSGSWQAAIPGMFSTHKQPANQAAAAPLPATVPQPAPPAPATTETATSPPTSETAPTADNKATEPAVPAETESADAESAAEEAPSEEPSEPLAAKRSQQSTSDDRLIIKGESYLYGRGVPQDCHQALVYLRAAAQQGNSKGRSRLGALYATGHCVPQDRAIAYKYFTQALGAGRGDIWLERNRAMLWREMNDEEKQRATR